MPDQPEEIATKAKLAERAACVNDIYSAFQGPDRDSDQGWLCNAIVARIMKRAEREDLGLPENPPAA